MAYFFMSSCSFPPNIPFSDCKAAYAGPSNSADIQNLAWLAAGNKASFSVRERNCCGTKTFRSKTECVALLPLLFSCCFPLVLEYLKEGLMVMADSSLWELLFLCEWFLWLLVTAQEDMLLFRIHKNIRNATLCGLELITVHWCSLDAELIKALQH